MTRSEIYESIDEEIAKENSKELKEEVTDEKERTHKGSGSGFVCSLECKTCGVQ